MSSITGKSMFLYFILIERILNGQPTAFQGAFSRAFLMLGKHDVRVYPSHVWLDPSGFPGLWALVDFNAGLVQPRHEFTDSRSKFFVVQASPPQPARWKACGKNLSASIAVMNLWSWEEIYIGGSARLDHHLVLY
jgi:hypothetical protein